MGFQNDEKLHTFEYVLEGRNSFSLKLNNIVEQESAV